MKILFWHTLIILIPTILFGWYGFCFAYGLTFGRELAQTEYRIFKLQNRNWKTLKWNDYFELKHWKSLNGGWIHTINNIILPPIIVLLFIFLAKIIQG